MKKKIKVTVIGLGYVGLPTLLLLSNNQRFSLYGYDININLLEQLRNGKTTINEKSIKNLLIKNLKNQKFKLLNTLEQSDIFIITVPSDINKNFRQNTKPLIDVINKISNVLKNNNLIIIETTSEPGTTSNLLKLIYKKNKNLFSKKNKNPKFYLAYCPERIFPGNILYELKNNPRLIGGINKKSNFEAKKFFKHISKKLIITDDKTAEISKLVENSYRNVQIGFVNELANYAQKHNLDIKKIINLANLHPRINLLNPGIGIGGHCIPVDPYFLIKNKNKNFQILTSSINVNNKRVMIISKIIKKLINEKKIKEINFFGLTYKPDVNDFRESPAVKIIKKLTKLKKIIFNIHDPFIKTENNFISKRFNINPKFNLIKKDTLNILLVAHKNYVKLKKTKGIIDFTY